MIRILLADDHQMMREGLRSLLSKQADFQVIGEADEGGKVLEMARTLNPDLVIMDIHIPGLDGIEATRILRSENPKVKVLALSMYSNRRFVEDMIHAGATGYLLKECAFQELTDAIRSIIRDETYLSPRISHIFLERLIPTAQGTPSINVLNEREREVLRLIALGKSTKEIATHIQMSGKTVDACRRQIMEKLNMHSIADLIKYAIREGLVKVEI